jgi:hypothetical protein
MKSKTIILLALAALTAACTSSEYITTNSGATVVTGNIDSSHWVFTADRMLPQYGRSNAITGGYNVTYDPKKLVVYLPYIGRAYGGAGVPGEGNPLGFTSVEFKETRKEGKKGRLIVTIQPTDYREIQTMIFTFFDNGNANLDVTFVNRSGVSFTGRVEPVQ